MPMNGMAEAAYEELKFRYYDQAVAQGMRPSTALALAERAASDTLGPLRPVGSSEDIWGSATRAERQAAPRVAMSESRPVRRRAAPAAAAPRAMVTSGGGTVRPFVRRNTPAEAAALMETAAMGPLSVRGNTPAEAAALIETAGRDAIPSDIVPVRTGYEGGRSPMAVPRMAVRGNTPAEVAALMEVAGRDAIPEDIVPIRTGYEGGGFPPPPDIVPVRTGYEGGSFPMAVPRMDVRGNTPAEAAALIEAAMLQNEPDVRLAPAVGPGAEALVEVPVSFARAAERVLMRPKPVALASGAEGIRMEPAPRARLAPAATDIMMEPARNPLYVRSSTPEEVAALMETAAAYEEPRMVRSPGVYDMAPDMGGDRALEEAAARAFSAPPPPPVTLERSSLADSLLRALGLR